MNVIRYGTLEVAYVISNPYLIEPDPEPEVEEPEFNKALYTAVKCLGAVAAIATVVLIHYL